MPKIISVQPTEQYFSLTWMVGIRCNYDCMYCDPAWHDDHSPHHELETLKQAWINIFEKTKNQGLKYKIAFTGGELTTNKNFLPFLSWLRSNYGQYLYMILLSTNGSANLKYYQRMFDLVDNITFSVHSEHINEAKFFDLVTQLKRRIDPPKFIQVAIMDEYWNQQRILMYKKLLDEHGISYTVNTVDYSHQTRSIPIMRGKLNLEV